MTGTIVDRAGKPLADVDVLLILKTWPNNRYQQQDFAGKTDKHGQFRFEKLIPTEGQRAIHLAAVKDGYCLTSMYELKKSGEAFETDQFKLRLDDAVRLTLEAHDASGRPVGKASVIPSSRKSTKGDEHGVYFQAAKPIEAATDAEGRVPIAVFQRGDRAEIYLQLHGGDWEQISFDVPAKGDVVKVSSKQVAATE